MAANFLGAPNAAAERTRKAFTLSVSKKWEGVIIILFALGNACLVGAFFGGLYNKILIQLSGVCAAAVFILLGDLIVLRSSSNPITKLYYNMIVYHVDMPMLFAFLSISVAIYFQSPGESGEVAYLSALFAGAVAFQLVAFNILFLFVWDSVIRMSVGPFAPLVLPGGGLSSSHPEFKSSWAEWGKRET